VTFANGFDQQVLGTDTFDIITSNQPITGAFSNIANGARLATVDGLGSFLVNYGPDSHYGSNMVVLSAPESLTSVPEPRNAALCILGGMVLLSLRIRRRSVVMRH
jgi:hypothetical protein